MNPFVVVVVDALFFSGEQRRAVVHRERESLCVLLIVWLWRIESNNNTFMVALK
jgi:hypothetical protein